MFCRKNRNFRVREYNDGSFDAQEIEHHFVAGHCFKRWITFSSHKSLEAAQKACAEKIHNQWLHSTKKIHPVYKCGRCGK